jgi:hypothetical protein
MKYNNRISHLILSGSLFFLVSLNIVACEGYIQKFDCFSCIPIYIW